MSELTHRHCPFCKSSDAFSYSTENGMFSCFSCGATPKLKGGRVYDGKTLIPWGNKDEVIEEGLLLEPYTRDYRGIGKKILEQFGVYFTKHEDKETVHYHYAHAVKNRTLPKSITVNGQLDTFFGQEDYISGKSITITEGEEDRLSVIQMMGDYPAVSVPGANPSKAFWINAREYLKGFDKIVLSIDNDEPGDLLAEKFSRAFPGKVYRVSHGKYKDANDFLVNGDQQDFKSAWWNAQRIKPENVNTTAEDFLRVYEETPNYEFFKTGIEELDAKMLGIHKSAFTLILAPTGIGKSLAPETKVIKYDGSVVRADEVKVGDKLLGPDSTPRNVTNVNLQTGPMYVVTPVKGEPFKCNSDHILSLKKTGSDEIKNVTVTEYLAWSKTQKHLWKLWRTGEVWFDNHSYDTEDFLEKVYCFGAYLGDGRSQGPEICMGKHKEGVLEFFESKVEITRKNWDRGAWYVGFSKESWLWGWVKNYLEVRRIPENFKTHTVSARKHLLAGLLDADGSITNGGAEITQKSENLADDIVFIARSLGLAAYKKVKVVKGVRYYRVTISGDMTSIPCIRLKFRLRKQIKDVLKTGFKVESIGEGEYRGIALDGDHLFVMGDFTVTHNTEFFRYLEYQCYKNSEYSLAFCHGEETELRSLLGLVSYELQDNLTRKDLIEEKNREQEVKDTLKSFGESERLYQFSINLSDSVDDIIGNIQFLATAMNVDFFFIEPIQDFVSGDTTTKENLLTDMVNKMKRLARELNIGIVVVAHANEDGDAKYCKSITQSAAYEIILKRDRESGDPVEQNKTYISVGRKNRTGGGSGPAGALDFNVNTYNLTPDIFTLPVEVKKKTKEKVIVSNNFHDDDIPF